MTLIELMVTVSVLAVLAAVAAPSFTPLMERWRVRSAAEALQSTIYYARSEAIKRGGGVTITANGADWGGGWVVANSDGTLQETAALNKITVTASKTTLYLNRWGMVSDSAGGVPTALDFLLTPANKDENAASATRVCIRVNGLIQHLPGSEECNPSTPDPDPDP